MAFPAYSKRLAGPFAVATSVSSVVLTVPVGRVWVVRYITLQNQSDVNTSTCQVSIGPGTTVANRFHRRTLTPLTSSGEDVRWVLHAGESLGAYLVVAGFVTMTLHGYDLTA